MNKFKKIVTSTVAATALIVGGGVALTAAPATAGTNTSVYHAGHGQGVDPALKLKVITVHDKVKYISKGQYGSFADYVCPPKPSGTTKFYLKVWNGVNWYSLKTSQCGAISGTGTYHAKIYRAYAV